MSDVDAAHTIAEADALVEQIRPLLRGQPPHVQSMALADLTAAWLAGHLVHQDKIVDPERTKTVREQIVFSYLSLVRELLPLHHARIMATNAEGIHDRASDGADG